MAIIGTLTKTQAGFAGTIKTLALDIGVTLRPAEKETDKAPDYRFYAGDADVGAAWQKVSAAGLEYLSCKFDDPSFPAPVYASLVLREDGKTCDLIWSR